MAERASFQGFHGLGRDIAHGARMTALTAHVPRVGQKQGLERRLGRITESDSSNHMCMLHNPSKYFVISLILREV